MTQDSQLPKIRVTEVGEFIRHHSCERRFKLQVNDMEEARKIPFFDRLFNPLDPVLQLAGQEREEEWEEILKDSEFENLVEESDRTVTPSAGLPDPSESKTHTEWADFVERLAHLSPEEKAYAREIRIEGELGAFHLSGQVDFILVLWRDGEPWLRLIECKGSRRDKTYHRAQVALYRMLIHSFVKQHSLTIGGRELDPANIECVVARIDESTNSIQNILELEPIDDLSQEEEDINRLIMPGGRLQQIYKAELPSLPYQLSSKCQTCVFNVHCFPESSRLRRLELLGLDPTSVRMLHEAGITDIDDMADLDLSGPAATYLLQQPTFNKNLEVLKAKAQARRSTLPLTERRKGEYPVMNYRHSGKGQLPEHDQGDQQLIRIFLNVDYDYVENRIAGLTAHVTRSAGKICTPFEDDDSGEPSPVPQIKEAHIERYDEDENPVYSYGLLVHSEDLVKFKTSPWSGRYTEDTAAEKELIQDFFTQLVDAIASVAAMDEQPTQEAPVHFYVWSRNEITRLVEACTRAGSGLLMHLNELLGCRESLEQMIFSCLQDEIDQRYALGWTGRGLSVATSLPWYGWKYHWKRLIAGEEVDLDWTFRQDIFDFKTTLAVDESTNPPTWARPDDKTVPKRRYEIRGRFYDSLPAPYLRAHWGQLPDPEKVQQKNVAQTIKRYYETRQPNYLRTYLKARVHALRWIEERIRFKNDEIQKTPLNIAQLPDFSLEVDNTAQAAEDFLRLDQHVKMTDWTSHQLIPPAYRLSSGRTLPLKNVHSHGNGYLTAELNLEGFHMDKSTLEANCTIGEGSFVRLSPCFDDPTRGQSVSMLLYGGSTCKVLSVDWQTGELELQAIYAQGDIYKPRSKPWNDPQNVFDYATADESPADFVAGRVESKLQASHHLHASEWFDPQDPQIPAKAPLSKDLGTQYEALLHSLQLPGGESLESTQAEACLEGLDARIQLLQGPPGTGKTTTTAVATLLRTLNRNNPGDIVLIGTNTHSAVDNLLEKIAKVVPSFRTAAETQGFTCPPIRVGKIKSKHDDRETSASVEEFYINNGVSNARNAQSEGQILILGGTTNGALQLANKFSESATFEGYMFPLLVVDEASMMVFPHFLALATLVDPEGEIMLAGDHRQLAPIIAHDWEQEDRPPVVIYQPFKSAYEAVQNIQQHKLSSARITSSALHYSFRLPAEIRELIGRLYRRDQINLSGRDPEYSDEEEGEELSIWEQVWIGHSGLYLITHDEAESNKRNETEASIVKSLIDNSGEQPPGSVAVVTPHRSQRTLLQNELDEYFHREDSPGPVDVVDTVERLQGGERDTVIVSATESDPAAISANVEFILDLRRSNVAFSRARNRLIVICSKSLLDHVPADTEHYDSAMLWKYLRSYCPERVGVSRLTVDGVKHAVEVHKPSLQEVDEATTPRNEYADY